MKLFVQDDLTFIYCVCVFLDNSFAAVLNAHEIVVEKAAFPNFTSPVELFYYISISLWRLISFHFLNLLMQLTTYTLLSKTLKTIIF